MTMARWVKAHQTLEARDERGDFRETAGPGIYRRAQSGDFAALVLIADPQTLGQIRPSLHKEVQSRLVCEIAKTLTKASIVDIQGALK